ncbi:MAG: biotin transporter BioY [Candidatus Marinimicrobia bacterium]|nr:biotin transporter BioY [Candidatus Neomarinimicrobiota bacterium]
MINSKILDLKSEKLSILYNIIIVLSGSILIALFSQISIRIPFSPVPITGQTLAIMLVGVMLGSKKGALSVLIYLLEGAVGIPVFANFSGGIQHLLGPTGGYLFSFIIATFIIGYFYEKNRNRNLLLSLFAVLLTHLIIFGIGLSWLSFYVGLDKVLSIGFFPFIPGAFIKITLFFSIVYGYKFLTK